jgi:hypothetical protein
LTHNLTKKEKENQGENGRLLEVMKIAHAKRSSTAVIIKNTLMRATKGKKKRKEAISTKRRTSSPLTSLMENAM